ncbi:hypothetical protein Ae168Ps1_5606 [Pseudonocardia sp. Ae168_Ps1]|nr:hypothetical protein Ae168Ps1_5606 [Pseudonocardia sp. Ae168_Ps1]OLL77346.1 hypothetical protein Ae150APs1_5724c [Pseudonocardia sp. Ae150A_Ps1]OLL88543.1 hypothetical protein Ae263Ps1_5598 [Pseudonocardia sp. Ae263_Ps1]OLL91435.1 hypothetical protein Ae356Ps1_1332c [Pseudonocardia sp. Ae356_Ps1]
MTVPDPSPESPAAVVTGSPGAAAVAAEAERDPDPATLAELVAGAVTAHPSVVRLDGGVFGAVATWLPGRRLVGVHVGGPGEPVEIGVVLNLDRPIPATVAALRRTVAPLVGGAPIDVTVSDVEIPGGSGTA